MTKKLFVLAVSIFMAVNGFSATNNSGNAPTFLWITLSSNSIGATDGPVVLPLLSPETIDVGVDVGADGTVDKWLSEEFINFLGRGNSETVNPGSWRTVFIALDEFAGQQAKIVIVDNDPASYIAINSIRLNFADGTVVENLVPNGDFEASSLEGWSITGGDVTDPASLVVRDEAGDFIAYEDQFLTTQIGGENTPTVTLESDTFTLEPVSSFIYFMGAGGVSDRFSKEGFAGTDNGSFIYLDVGTATEDPNGQYDEGVDVPAIAFFTGSAASFNDDMHSQIMNTSGLEGRRAQFVVVDNSEFFAVGLDGVRMNWDWEQSIITNGDFEEGITDPQIADEIAFEYTEHASGGIPGWTVNKEPDGDASVFFRDETIDQNHRSRGTYVGTGGLENGEVFWQGVELRSDVFTIEAIPAPSEMVFVQWADAQGTTEIRFEGFAGGLQMNSVQLRIDVNENGVFEEAADFTYWNNCQGLGWSAQISSQDHPHMPEYRFIIKPEHYGKPAQFFFEDNTTNGWDWSGFDDVFVWDGSSAELAFPNSDFEMGSLENWTEVNDNPDALRTWLSGDQELWLDGTVLHRPLNNRPLIAWDGRYSADSADHSNDGGAGGDGGRGSLTSTTFTLPTLGSSIGNWSVLD